MRILFTRRELRSSRPQGWTAYLRDESRANSIDFRFCLSRDGVKKIKPPHTCIIASFILIIDHERRFRSTHAKTIVFTNRVVDTYIAGRKSSVVFRFVRYEHQQCVSYIFDRPDWRNHVLSAITLYRNTPHRVIIDRSLRKRQTYRLVLCMRTLQKWKTFKLIVNYSNSSVPSFFPIQNLLIIHIQVRPKA